MSLLDTRARTTRAERMNARIEFLSRLPALVTVARVARTFRMDPVAVLRDGGDPRLVHIRIAAMLAVARDEEEQAKRAKRK